MLLDWRSSVAVTFPHEKPHSAELGACLNLDTTYRVLRPHVIFENVEGELILVHLQKGCYFSVDAVGAEVWSLIDNGHALGQIVESVRFRWDAPADQIR